MMPRNQSVIVLGLAFVVLAISGCQSDFRCETTLYPDGSVERAIVQPLESTPFGWRREGLWKTGEVVRYQAQEGWQGPQPYVKAEGKFPSVGNLPDSLRIQFRPNSPFGFLLAPFLPSGKLVRRHERVDYVLAVEDRWAETLSDTVTLVAFRQGCDELADLGIQIGEDVFQEALGKDYEATALFQWLRTEGKAWLADLTDYAYMERLALRPLSGHANAELPQDVLNSLVEICTGTAWNSAGRASSFPLRRSRRLLGSSPSTWSAGKFAARTPASPWTGRRPWAGWRS